MALTEQIRFLATCGLLRAQPLQGGGIGTGGIGDDHLLGFAATEGGQGDAQRLTLDGVYGTQPEGQGAARSVGDRTDVEVLGVQNDLGRPRAARDIQCHLAGQHLGGKVGGQVQIDMGDARLGGACIGMDVVHIVAGHRCLRCG